ncbi:MAG: hypothetical protein ACYDBB_25075 [Armatimonadota bacterium]
MIQQRSTVVLCFGMMVLALIAGRSIWAAPFQVPITVEEHLGYAWDSDLVHRDIALNKAGQLFPGRVALYQDKRMIPMQLDGVTAYPDGSIKTATVWFRTDLPAKGRRAFTLRALTGKQAPMGVQQTDVTLKTVHDVIEITNAHTGIRLPAAGTAILTDSDKVVNGPILGIKLASGQWTAPTRISIAGAFQGCTIKIIDMGLIFIRARIEYRFADEGKYTATYTVRSGEPLVRVDEQYTKAGEFSWDLYPGLQPKQLADHVRAENFDVKPISYEKTNTLPSFVGWDYYLTDRSMVMAFCGGPADDLLGLLTTDSDWLPFPYKNMWEMSAEPGPKLNVKGSLAAGQRHYAVLVGKGADYPDTSKAVYRWWHRHIDLPLDKVANWQLVWPNMEKIAFPHTFFGKEDIPGIRQRLQADPESVKFMTALRDDPRSPNSPYYWNDIKQKAEKGETPELRAKCADYIAKYAPKGIVCSVSDQVAWYLYSGDDLYLRQLREDAPAREMESPFGFLKAIERAYLDGLGAASEHRMHGMELCDRLFMRLVGMDLVLGSELTPEERRENLTHLAFLNYLLYDTLWLPVNHPYYGDGSEYIGYAQGTENQKQGIWMLRGMTAAMLTNHPRHAAWLKQALDDNARNMPYQINKAGTFYESANYSPRTTSRIPPFWIAMTRAGGKDEGGWMDAAKMTFQFLGDQLTPPDPRFKGIRAYHPFGRGEPGNVDSTLLEGVSPWGLTDTAHGERMRWLWESMGKPPIDHGGGRDTSLHLLAASYPFKAPESCPLTSRRWEGFGAVLRSNAGTDFESNVVVKHGAFCWAMGDNQGSVVFWGKDAPLLPRFGAWWMAQKDQMMMQAPHFNNRIIFAQGDNTDFGEVTDYAGLGAVADYAVSRNNAGDWQRGVLFAKDLSKDDPVYLLVRDDVSRNCPTAVHWWFMTKDVLPEGPHGKPVVDFRPNDEPKWIANIGTHWKDAPKLTGPVQHFTGAWGVDVDMVIARPANPSYVVDAAGVGPGIPYCADNQYQDCMKLVRVEGGPQGYTTLLVPRWPGSAAPEYRSIAEGAGVAVKWTGGEDRLFLADKVVTFTDEAVQFNAQAGFARRGPAAPLRLMVVNGSITANGITLTCPGKATLLFDGKTITVTCATQVEDVKVSLPDKLKDVKVTVEVVR